MKIKILALLSALAMPALGEDLNVIINPHSSTEVAMAAAAGFSSVEEWYADLNRNMILPNETASLNRTWASLSPEVRSRLAEAEIKWAQWYNALPFTTPRDIVKRIDALGNRRLELEAWIPQPKPQPARLPPTSLNDGM
jgi:hypothetical protein